MRAAKSPTAMTKTRLFILHISLLCIASSAAEMTSSVTSSMTSSEGSIALSATEETSLAGQSMKTLADMALSESITAASVTAESADDTKMPTSASMVLLTTSASLASSTLRTLPVPDSQSEQTFTDPLSQSSPSVPRSSDFMSNSQKPTPEIMTSTTPLPPAAFSTKDETPAPNSIPSAATLSTPVLTANVSTGDLTAALSTSNTFITSESTLSTPVPTATVSTEDFTEAPRTHISFLPSTLSTPVPIAIINSSLSAAITPLSASLATFTITAVLTSESIPLLSGSTLKSTEFAQPRAISSPITAQPAPTPSTHITSVSTSTFTISTLMTPQQVTQEHQDSTVGSIDHTRMSTSAESSTSAVTSTATDIKPEQTVSLASTFGSLQMPASSSLVPSVEPSATSAPEVSSTTSSSLVPSATSTSVEPSATSAPEVSSITTSSLVPSGTLPSVEPSATSAPEVSSITTSSLVPSATLPSVEPSATSTSEVPFTTSASQEPSAISTSLVPSATSASQEPPATSTLLVSSATSILFVPSATSPSLMPSATSPSLMPSATSPSLMPSATSPSLMPSATSPSLMPSATSPSLMPSATSRSLMPSATSPSLMPSATSTSLVPSATSTLLLPSTTSPSLEPLATSTLLVSSATSTSLMSSATSTSLVSSATSTSSPTSDRQSEQTFTDTVPPESLTEIYVTTSTPATTSTPHITSTASSLTTVNSISSSVSPTTSTATSHLTDAHTTTSVFTPSASALSSPVLTPTSTSTSSVQSTSLLSSTSQPSSTGSILASVTTDSTSLPASPITPPLSTHTSVLSSTATSSPTSVTPASPSDQTGSGDTGIVVGVSIGVVLLLAVVVCVLVVVKLRVMKKRPLYGRMGSKKIRKSSETSIEMTSVITAVDNYENFQPGDIDISGLAEYIARKMQNNELDEEYKALPSTPFEDTDEHVGQLACNKEKNRFADIFAYDCSRVVLQRGDASGTDYINANFITGYGDKQRAYIAAQGPNPRSLADFWLMIWQEDVRCVVMLTNLRENNRRKCEKYWPDEGSRDSYGDVDVSCTCEDVTSTYVVRVLQAGHHTKTTETRRIVQYHFTTWPDHGVPSAPSLVEFWQQVKEHKSTIRPLVVHCSAGVGRTGTFIGLDALMERCKVESTVNVFRRVSSVRGERMSTVQTRRQYTFLHLVLLEALYSEGTHRLCEELVAGTRCEEDRIYKEFQMLQELRDLNRNRAAPNHAEDEGDDVSNIPSYTSDVEFLLTSSSQPANAANHLWSMVDDYKATIILAICDEVATGIIPSPIGESLLDDSLLLTLTSSSFISEHVRETEIVAEPDDDTHSEDAAKPWKVTLFSTPSVTASVSEVITLVEHLENTRHLATESIVVYSCPDSHPATLLCIIWNIIQRLQRHPGVDIFLIVREMQSIKPSYHISQDDYRFLYTLASEYVTSTSIYANAYV
ncbi:flocculation protein FLO11-like isoform X2 [Haliotis rufescens]|uniref:flocculation protein FLO11-like isoform X2 n=1 Tax=Haliotis rufescens TaxID=6454 RepID=UPI00201EFDB9|nr:flocculation protein FLO11-like isoform X2 [Haliotis rufescens]